MSIRRVVLLALASVPLLAASASAQQRPTGAELLATKCFQCHTPGDVAGPAPGHAGPGRRTSTGWWARGALWSTEEIKLMAEYLGTDFGPHAAGAERETDSSTPTRMTKP